MTTPSHPVHMPPRPFDMAWTIEDSTALLHLTLQGDDQTLDASVRKSAREAAWAMFEQLGRASCEHVRHLAEQGQVSAFPHTAGRCIESPQLWDILIGHATPTQWQTLEAAQARWVEVLSATFTYTLMWPKTNLQTPEAYDQALRHLARDGHLGRLEHEAYCSITGQRHALALEGWTPILLERDATRRMVPVTEDGPGEQFDTVQVAFPSGEVLVSDWIRLPGFTRQDQDRESKIGPEGEDINCERGRMAAVRGCAGAGFVYVHGGSDRELFVREGHLIVGYTNPNHPAPPGTASLKINGPLRGTVIIDRAELQRLLLADDPSQTPELVDAQIQAYMKDPSNEVHTLQIRPGTHHLYFSGGSRTMHAQFAAAEVDLTRIEPLFVLSEQPLTLVPPTPAEHAAGPARAARPRPR